MHPSRVRTTLPWYGRLGLLLHSFAFVIILPCVFMPVQVFGIVGFQPQSAIAFGIAIVVTGFGGACVGAVLKWIGFKLHERALKTLAPNARELLARDTRPPVVYLRTFDADARAASTALLMSIAPSGLVGTTAERVLCEFLGAVGPVVAVGKPGDALPELGAARLYAAHDAWQDEVVELIGQASLVIVRAGHSAGILWELELVFRCVPFDRIVMLIPQVRGFDYGLFVAQFAEVTHLALPPLPRTSIGIFPLGVRAIVLFAEGKEVVLRPFPAPHMETGGATGLGLETLFPVAAGAPSRSRSRPAHVEFGGYLCWALGPVFARHRLSFADPIAEYDLRTRPHRFDRELGYVTIAIVVGALGLSVFALAVAIVHW